MFTILSATDKKKIEKKTKKSFLIQNIDISLIYQTNKNNQKLNKMKQAILNVTYKHNGNIYSNEFVLFEGDILENLLPDYSIIIQVTFLTSIN